MFHKPEDIARLPMDSVCRDKIAYKRRSQATRVAKQMKRQNGGHERRVFPCRNDCAERHGWKRAYHVASANARDRDRRERK